jgi:hypothetical protein
MQQPIRSKHQLWAHTNKFVGLLEASFCKQPGAKQARELPGEKYDSPELLRLVGSQMLKDFHAADTLPDAIRQVDVLANFTTAMTAALPSFCSSYGDVQLPSFVKLGAQLTLVLADLTAYHPESNSHDEIKQRLKFLISDLNHRFAFALDGVAAIGGQQYQQLYRALEDMIVKPLEVPLVVAKLGDVDLQAAAKSVSDACELDGAMPGHLVWPDGGGPHAQFAKRGLFYMLPNFGYFHVLLAQCEQLEGPELDGYTELNQKAVVLRAACVVAVRMINELPKALAGHLDETLGKQLTASFTQYLHMRIQGVIQSLHSSGVKLLLDARQGFATAGLEHKDEVFDLIDIGDTLDGNVLYKKTTCQTASNLHMWWKSVFAGTKEQEKFASTLRIAVPIDGPLIFDVQPLVMAADQKFKDSDDIVKAKMKVAHLTIVQAAFRPLASGEARTTFQEQGKAQLLRLGVTVGPKFSFLLGQS